MEFLVASAIGVMTAAGIYLVLRARTFPVVIGLSLLTYATNLFLFATGRLAINQPPVISAEAVAYIDPLPQALVLTAIVIAFAMTAVSIVLAMRSRSDNHSDHVDAHEEEQDTAPADTAPGREGGA